MVCNVGYLVVLCFWSQVDSAKKQYNVQISQLTEELLALHMVWTWLLRMFGLAKYETFCLSS